MSDETIDHATLSRLASAGVVQTAHVEGRAGGWAVTISLGDKRPALTAQKSRRMRLFRRMETLVDYLKGVGIVRFDVDATGHSFEPADRKTRPDRADALRDAHEAAAHDRWFRDQVAQALGEADGEEAGWLPHDKAQDEWARRRARYASGDASRARR